MSVYVLYMSCIAYTHIPIGVFDSKDKILDFTKEIIENGYDYDKDVKFDIQEFELNKLLYDVEVLRASARVKNPYDEEIDKI